jgi:hypothetical protein
MKQFLLSVFLFCSFQVVAMDSKPEVNEPSDCIDIQVTSTDLGGKLGSINSINFTVKKSTTIQQLIMLTKIKLFASQYEVKVTQILGPFSTTLCKDDTRTLEEAGFEGKLILKASRVYNY